MYENLVAEAFSLEFYKDRQNRLWNRVNADHLWRCISSDQVMTDEAISLLIVREAHRDDCPGLYYCSNHPVPFVCHSRLTNNYIASNGNARTQFEKLEYAFRKALKAKTVVNYASTCDKEKSMGVFSEYLPKSAVPALVNG